MDATKETTKRGPFVATLVWETFAEPARQWTDDEGVEHIRGQASEGSVTGDVDFVASNVFNSDWDPNNKRGEVFGPYTFGSADETWNGYFAGRMDADRSVGTWDGTSDRRRRLAGTFDQVGPGAYRCEWYILGTED